MWNKAICEVYAELYSQIHDSVLSIAALFSHVRSFVWCVCVCIFTHSVVVLQRAAGRVKAVSSEQIGHTCTASLCSVCLQNLRWLSLFCPARPQPHLSSLKFLLSIFLCHYSLTESDQSITDKSLQCNSFDHRCNCSSFVGLTVCYNSLYWQWDTFGDEISQVSLCSSIISLDLPWALIQQH